MSVELKMLVENVGVVEAMRQLLEAPDKFKTTRRAVEQRFSVVSSFLLMPTRRAKDLYRMINSVAALGGNLTLATDEKLRRIADSSVPDSERATGLARLNTCIAADGVIVALDQAIASPALFGLTDAQIAYKLQNIKRVMAISDDAIRTVQTLESALERLGPEEEKRARR